MKVIINHYNIDYREIKVNRGFGIEAIVYWFYDVSYSVSYSNPQIYFINHLINPICFFKNLHTEKPEIVESGIGSLFRHIDFDTFELLLKYWKGDKSLHKDVFDHFERKIIVQGWNLNVMDHMYGKFLNELDQNYKRIYNNIMIKEII